MDLFFMKELQGFYIGSREMQRVDVRASNLMSELEYLIEKNSEFDYYYVKDERIILIPLVHLLDPSIDTIQFLKWTFYHPVILLRIEEWIEDSIIVSSLTLEQVSYIQRRSKVNWKLIS